MVNRFFLYSLLCIIGFSYYTVNILFDLLISVKALSPQKTAPPVSLEESFPLTVMDSQPVACNYVDCTESNDEEGDDEEEEEESEGKGDTINNSEKKNEPEGNGSSNPPKWEDFFTTEMLPDSQNSVNSQSCPVSSPSLSRMTGSQTPELFSGEEEEETPNNNENFSLTLSASLSNHSSQNQDLDLLDTLILRPENPGLGQGDSRNTAASQENKNNNQNVQADLEELSESQASSDFDIPSTPDSKKPRSDELLQLYRKLAAGEDVLIGECS